MSQNLSPAAVVIGALMANISGQIITNLTYKNCIIYHVLIRGGGGEGTGVPDLPPGKSQVAICFVRNIVSVWTPLRINLTPLVQLILEEDPHMSIPVNTNQTAEHFLKCPHTYCACEVVFITSSGGFRVKRNKCTQIIIYILICYLLMILMITNTCEVIVK